MSSRKETGPVPCRFHSCSNRSGSNFLDSKYLLCCFSNGPVLLGGRWDLNWIFLFWEGALETAELVTLYFRIKGLTFCSDIPRSFPRAFAVGFHPQRQHVKRPELIWHPRCSPGFPVQNGQGVFTHPGRECLESSSAVWMPKLL